MNKTDQALKDAIARDERRALWSAGAVVFGLVLEVGFAAAFHAPPETMLSHWGPVVADASVALGVAGEVLFGRKARTASEELTRRSEERVAEAQLRLEELQKRAGPRDIDREIFKRELEGKPKSRVQIWYLPDISDGYWLASRLLSAVISAGWDFARPPLAPMPELSPDPDFLNGYWSAAKWHISDR